MATTVSSILTQIKTIAAAELGATWHELRKVYEVEKNDERTANKGYGARPLDAVNFQTVTNAYALDHTFQLILSDSIPRTDDDDQLVDVITSHYDKLDEIFKAMVRSKLNLTGTVMLVSDPSIAEPELINGGQSVVLRMDFVVKYRQLI